MEGVFKVRRVEDSPRVYNTSEEISAILQFRLKFIAEQLLMVVNGGGVFKKRSVFLPHPSHPGREVLHSSILLAICQWTHVN